LLLRDILQQAWVATEPAAQKLLASLHNWRERVGHVALKLLNSITEAVGSYDYFYHTTPLSIYMWWRVCKMVADIEVIANHGNKSECTPGYFELMADLFLELWMGFVSTLERDLRIINLTLGERDDGLPCKQRHRIDPSTLLGEGTFKAIQDPDILPEVNPGYEMQYEVPDAISETHWTDLALKTRAQRIYAKVGL
jgi:hypothetical protein